MIRLHHSPQTRSMRSLWLLHELGVDFDLVTYPFDKSLRQPAYLALNPAGRVPALEIDGGVMFETGAITEYLCERFSPNDLGRAPGHSERMAWLTWLHFAETISQHAAALTQQHIALYDDAMRSPIVMKLEAARLGKCFDALEGQLDGRLSLLDSFSAVDVSVGQAVYLGRMFRRLEDWPGLAAWYQSISAREAFQASLPGPDELIYKQDFYEAWDV